MAVIILLHITLHSQIEEGLYYNFNPEVSFYIQENTFTSLEEYETNGIDSFNIEMLQYDSSDLINDKLEVKLLRQGVLAPFVELNIKGDVSDSLEAFDFYVIGKIVDKLKCDLTTLIIYVEDAEDPLYFRLLLGLNFKAGELRSMLKLADDSYNRSFGPYILKSYLEDESCDTQRIRMHISLEFHDVPNYIIRDSTVLKITSQGEIKMLD